MEAQIHYEMESLIPYHRNCTEISILEKGVLNGSSSTIYKVYMGGLDGWVVCTFNTVLILRAEWYSFQSSDWIYGSHDSFIKVIVEHILFTGLNSEYTLVLLKMALNLDL